MNTITHPHALAAIWLAHKLAGMPSEIITQCLQASGVPRRLFVLASVLRAQEAA